MIETLIPFLLVAHVPIDPYDVYSGSQYTFNVSNNMEYDSEDGIHHLNIIAKLKCQYSEDNSLICSLANSLRQWYKETEINGTDPENPRYLPHPVHNLGPFQLFFNKNGEIGSVAQNFSGRGPEIDNMRDIAELLNIWWIDRNESESGLSKVDELIVKKKKSECQSYVKLTRQKQIPQLEKFKLQSIGKKLIINPGMTLNFKRVYARPCLLKQYSLPEHDDVEPKIFNVSNEAASSYHRVVISDNEFVSFIDRVANICLDSSSNCSNHLHRRIKVALDSIDKV